VGRSASTGRRLRRRSLVRSRGSANGRATSCTLSEVVIVSTSTQSSAPLRTVEPTILWDKVVKARAVVAQQRHLPSSRTSSIARAELLSALEAYVDSLTNRRRPIPYRLRDELRIRRLTRHE